MSSILVLKSSAAGAASVSNRLVDGLVAGLRRNVPGLQVVERDLDRRPVPHLGAATMAGIGRPAPVTPETEATRALADTLVAELMAADLVAIGAPMYNFGIASTLKSWFDHVLRPGVTFSYGPEGPKGLVPGKPVVVVETRGGLYSEGPSAPFDAQEPHLRSMLGFMGLTDVEFVRAEKLAFGPEAVEAAVAAATAKLSDLSARPLAKAA